MCLDWWYMYLDTIVCILIYSKCVLVDFAYVLIFSYTSWYSAKQSWRSVHMSLDSWHIHSIYWQIQQDLGKLPMQRTLQSWLGIRNPPKSPHPRRFWTNITNLFLSLTRGGGHTPTIGMPLYVQTFLSLAKSYYSFLLRNYTNLVIKMVWERLLHVSTLLIVTSRSQRCRRWNYITGVLEHTTVLAKNPLHGKHGWRSRDAIVLARQGE